jgi:SAM-dependent methyltransferase
MPPGRALRGIQRQRGGRTSPVLELPITVERNKPMDISESSALLNPDVVAHFTDKVVRDLGACLSAALTCVGDTLGLYRVLADWGPLTAEQLAARCDVPEEYAGQWLLNQAAGGYLAFDASSQRFFMPPEHAAVLADAASRHYLGQSFHAIQAVLRAQPEVFKAGYEPAACEGSGHASPEPFLLPGVISHLIERWVPALAGVEARFREGALAAEVDCAGGLRTIALARAYPNSHFFGFDADSGVLRRARQRAEAEGVAERTTFEPAPAEAIPNHRYALAVLLSGLCHLQDPVRVARRVLHTLAPDGSLLIVEHVAGERVEESFNAVGRMHSALAALRSFPPSPASARMSPGTRGTESELRAILAEAGFQEVHMVDETPFVRAFEAQR